MKKEQKEQYREEESEKIFFTSKEEFRAPHTKDDNGKEIL